MGNGNCYSNKADDSSIVEVPSRNLSSKEINNIKYDCSVIMSKQNKTEVTYNIRYKKRNRKSIFSNHRTESQTKNI
jgi:hypothetical protein